MDRYREGSVAEAEAAEVEGRRMAGLEAEVICIQYIYRSKYIYRYRYRYR